LYALVIISVALTLFGQRDESYMPPGSYSSEQIADERQRAFLSNILLLMGERKISNEHSREVTTIRCLFVPSDASPTLVKLEGRGARWQLTVKMLSGVGGGEFGDLIATRQRMLSRSEADVLLRSFEKVGLDGRARPTGGPPEYLHNDHLALEAWREGVYHVRFLELPNRANSGKDIKHACGEIAAASGFPAEALSMRELLLRDELRDGGPAN
jgi:hypothetical protein